MCECVTQAGVAFTYRLQQVFGRWLTLVALRASVTRSFFSLTSTSLAPPTLMTAMPPLSFASRSCSFSLHSNPPQ